MRNNMRIKNQESRMKLFKLNSYRLILNSEQGQSLIEVIVAAAVGILVVTALTFATIFSLRNASFAKNSAQATKLAQEGIERVRAGRDRNECITGLTNVNSWNGNSSDTSCVGTGSIWTYQINSACSNQLNPNCYFNIADTGVLNYFINGSSFPVNGSQLIPPNFKRVVILSDDSTSYTTQKKVTVIVTWTDFAGDHESKLTTILRKL